MSNAKIVWKEGTKRIVVNGSEIVVEACWKDAMGDVSWHRVHALDEQNALLRCAVAALAKTGAG